MRTINSYLEQRALTQAFSPEYKTTPEHLYKWHADDEDRYIESLNENDWSFQFDNELPQSLEPGKIIHIPKGLIHRLIKGKSNLSISIKS